MCVAVEAKRTAPRNGQLVFRVLRKNLHALAWCASTPISGGKSAPAHAQSACPVRIKQPARQVKQNPSPRNAPAGFSRFTRKFARPRLVCKHPDLGRQKRTSARASTRPVRIDQPSHSKAKRATPEWGRRVFLVGLAGFEPAKMPESKSGALPLGDSPMLCAGQGISATRIL